MSQCYRVTLKSSVRRVVRGQDSISYPIELTQILPPEEMVDVLRQQLVESGWLPTSEIKTIYKGEGPSGEMLTVDLDSMEITAILSIERELTMGVEVVGLADSNDVAHQQAEAMLEGEVAVLGDRLEEEGNTDIQIQATESLAASEVDRQRQINELLQQVYAESLKRKAHQLGDVMEMHESTGEDGNYELTIRIEQ